MSSEKAYVIKRWSHAVNNYPDPYYSPMYKGCEWVKKQSEAKRFSSKAKALIALGKLATKGNVNAKVVRLKSKNNKYIFPPDGTVFVCGQNTPYIVTPIDLDSPKIIFCQTKTGVRTSFDLVEWWNDVVTKDVEIIWDQELQMVPESDNSSFVKNHGMIWLWKEYHGEEL
jgi:hypothetical protein